MALYLLLLKKAIPYMPIDQLPRQYLLAIEGYTLAFHMSSLQFSGLFEVAINTGNNYNKRFD